MYINILETKSEGGRIIARLQFSTGESAIVKVRQSGLMQYINPPPEDNRCENCRQHVDDLEPFGKKICEGFKQLDKEFNEQLENPRSIVQSITADRKLIKIFRPNDLNIVEAFWICKECDSLTEKKVNEDMNKENPEAT